MASLQDSAAVAAMYRKQAAAASAEGVAATARAAREPLRPNRPNLAELAARTALAEAAYLHSKAARVEAVERERQAEETYRANLRAEAAATSEAARSL